MDIRLRKKKSNEILKKATEENLLSQFLRDGLLFLNIIATHWLIVTFVMWFQNSNYDKTCT